MLGETGAAAAGVSDVIKDGADATFMADVIEESRRQPVIVDFWATWCGPCKQLGPALEKAVAAAKGAVKLVKIDVDRNPAVAGQLRVQSIPTVYAFVDGRPVDGFQGAVPESQLKAFIDRLAAAGPAGPEAEDLEALLQMGAESLQLNDLGGAAQAFAQALQLDPENLRAIAGLGRVYLAGGETDRAREILEMAPKDARSPELDSLRAALQLAAAVPSDVAQYEHRLARDENDHEARLELAKALAGRHQLDEAAEHLLRIVEADRDWNDGAARAQLLQVFEAAGPGSETAKRGRRRLSAILFS
jgi:putative thioredoxin